MRPQRKESVSTIYERRSGPLDVITFLFSDGDDEQRYVEDVVLQNSDGAKPHFTWSDLRMVSYTPLSASLWRILIWEGNHLVFHTSIRLNWAGGIRRGIPKALVSFTIGG